MKSTRYNTAERSYGELASWLREGAEDNAERLAYLKRQLRAAREAELTARQSEVLRLHYEEGLRVTQIAEKLGLHKSTVSRTLSRGKARLRRYLKYCL